MLRTFFTVIILSLMFHVYGQEFSYKKTEIAIGKPTVIDVSKIETKWRPVLNHLEMPNPSFDQKNLAKTKEELLKKYPVKHYNNSYNKTTTINQLPASLPLLQRNFEGNLQNSGVPMDNDVAISNNGKLVSVTNNIIYMYDVNGNVLLKSISLDTFGISQTPRYQKFDPKALYDPFSDRFIIVYLNGFSSAATYITVAFSQTNDPTGIWNLYSINGNPFVTTQWSDYPMVSITEKDFFLTINLLKNGMPWQTGFAQTLIWQVGKDKGYSGQAIASTMYSNIEFDGRKIRNLCPAKGGDEIKAPNMYFVSNRNLAANNDSIFLVEVTNSQESGAAALTAKVVMSPMHYFVPPNARQAAGKTLQTNDSRILGAYYHNDKIQFVQNTLDTSTGTAGIYHGIMSNVSGTPTIKAHIISDTLLDYGYPNISYCGTNITHSGLSEPENESIISFSHTAPTVFAGISSVYYDNHGNYSDRLNVKSGSNYIYISFVGNNSRWGDYSGSQRKFNEPGKVWITSTFGQANNKYGTWIAELGSPQQRTVTPVEPNVIFFPNPVGETASVNFFLDKSEILVFTIYDDIGRLVAQLTETKSDEGQNIFSFSTAPLTSGTYFLVVKSATETIAKEKFVKY